MTLKLLFLSKLDIWAKNNFSTDFFQQRKKYKQKIKQALVDFYVPI